MKVEEIQEPSADSKWFNGEKDYMPYCLNCSTMARLTRTDNGAICHSCSIEFELSKGFLQKYKDVNGEEWNL